MKTCGQGCIVICQFCHHWYSKALDEEGYYDEDGFCLLRSKKSDILDECKDFYCFRLREKK